MTLSQDQRYTLMQAFLESHFQNTLFQIEIASNDASFRRYFRVTYRDKTYIVMDAPPDKEPLSPFIYVAEHLENYQVNVPHIFAANRDHGFLLLADLGSSPYLSILTPDNADKLYLAAIDGIITMQLATTSEDALPAYDEALLEKELRLFDTWFLQRHLGLDAPEGLDQLYALLIDNAQQQPQYFVHRDFHSRNIMYQADAAPGIIDFQDAVIGPVSYDLVSLLKDAYIQWPQTKIDQWTEYYYEQALHHKLLSNNQKAQFTQWFELMGLQRHLKILGIFCRLNYRDHKPNYMQDLKLTLKYVVDVVARYPQLASLHDFIVKHAIIRSIL